MVYLISTIILGTPNYCLHMFSWMMGAYSTVIAPLPPTASNYLLQGQVLGSRCYLEGAGAGGGLYLFLEHIACAMECVGSESMSCSSSAGPLVGSRPGEARGLERSVRP